MVKYKLIVLFTLLGIFISLNGYSQPNKRTNNWFFTDSVGLNFNSGVPVEDSNGILFNEFKVGTTIISDTNGNLLFYSNSRNVWNRDHEKMTGGSVGSLFVPGDQSSICFPMPGSDSKYYIFTSRYIDTQSPMFYFIIDMELNNGLGDISEIVELPGYFDGAEKITAAYKENKKDLWVITRSFRDKRYLSIEITENGVNLNPIISPAPSGDYTYTHDYKGMMKVSYNKKYIVSCFEGGGYTKARVEICSLDIESGNIEHLFHFRLRDIIVNNPAYRTYSCEFSPDSRFLYLPGTIFIDTITHLYQFDMNLVEDSAQFIQSATYIGEGQGSSIQLASDGKIYLFCLDKYIVPNPANNFVGTVHSPEKEGIACNYIPNEFIIDNGSVYAGLVNFLPDFLFRFDFDGICESDTFAFDPWFFPEPTFIEWNFGDPLSGANNTSTIPHATHKFTDGGTYAVSVYVEYPSGRIEETSREVEVEYAPEPDLGSDTTICSNTDIILDAACGPHFYSWSNGSFGSSQITVSDTGWYWVRVENDAGCFEIDSIHLSFLPEAIADTTDLEVIPTTCGGSTGVIKGLTVSGIEPLSWQWIDDLGNPIATSIDIYHLPVGNYTLEVLDSNGCTASIGPFSIIDAGEVLIDDVEFTNEHCGQQDGSITINATSGLSDMLFYSIDNGANYFTNQGMFTGLAAGSYAVRVRDSSDCQDVFMNNPIIIENLDAPEITSVNIGACAQGQSNGSIEITAIGGGDTLYYSNDNGVTFQVNDGGFYNLLAGFYTCVIMDEVGCDTTFVVEVPEEITLRLQAVAGEDEVCPGNTAFVPLYVSNFNDVAWFKTTLLYDRTLITCTGYANTQPQIEDSLEVMLFPAEGKVELLWHAPSVSLPDNTVLTDLVFESLDPGLSMVAWDGSAGASLFENSAGLSIPVDYYLGSVRIYEEVIFTLEQQIEACQGEDIEISPLLWSSNGEVSYTWSDPSGSTSNNEMLTISNARPTHSGTWSLRVSDTLDCYSEAFLEILIHPNPVPAFAGQDTITTEEPVEIDAGDGFTSYLWNTGETEQHITAEVEDWYSVMIESLYGCAGEDSVYVQFVTAPPPPPPPEEPPGELILLPNAFTPDGDGLNDEFKAIGQPDNLSSFSMTIFNRWGQMVFETKDVTQGWDGTYQGKPAPSGTYVYRLDYSISSRSFDTSGTVILVR